MNIEIVEFYPIKKGKNISGTLHVYLIDFDLDIRGIYVTKRGNTWFFQVPSRISEELNEHGKPIRYPVISFANREKEVLFRNTLFSLGKEYITKNFLNKKA